jgi:hypothetical protein
MFCKKERKYFSLLKAADLISGERHSSPQDQSPRAPGVELMP